MIKLRFNFYDECQRLVIESRDEGTRNLAAIMPPRQPVTPLGENFNYRLITCHLGSPDYHGN